MNDISLQQLTYIITHYGRSIIDDPRRCEALLRDLCPEQKREVNVLVSALKEDIPQDLISMNPSMPAELTFSRLRKRLYDDLGMAEDFAHWAVETWGLALGMVKQRTVPAASAKAAYANPQPAQADPVRTSPPQKKRPAVQLRSQPITVSDDDCERVFQLAQTGWCSYPLRYIENDYVVNGDSTVTDRATGLMWEQSGSKYIGVMTYNNAPEYIRDLNRKKFAGYSDWRLPTVEELLSLMEKEKQGNDRYDLYIHTVFYRLWWVWSADKCSSDCAWVVGFLGGSVYRFDLGDGHWVRGVRSL